MGEQSIEALSANTITFLCNYLKANIGSFYLFNDDENALVLSGKYAFLSPDKTKVKFRIDEGLIGQVSREKKQTLLSNLTEEHIRITSSVMNAKPKQLLISPVLLDGKTLGLSRWEALANLERGKEIY